MFLRSVSAGSARRLRWTTIAALIGVSALASLAQSPAERTRRALDLVLARNYQAFYALFSPEMNKAVTPEGCTQSFEPFRALGIPKSIGDPAVLAVQDLTVVTIPIRWSAGSIDFRVSWNSQGKIAGYFFLPGTPEAAPGDSNGGAGREVTFEGAGGLTLHGTLLLPVGKSQKAPGILLLPGSGPTDRNGNQPPLLVSDLLMQIAERLASDGYATLRFDKRAARTNAATWPKDVATQNEFFSWDAFVGDAKAALRFLQSRPEVDASRTIVAGHSEGGTIAIEVGRELAGKPNAPAGLVLLSCPGRPVGMLLREQIARGLKRAGVAEEAAKTQTEYIDRAIEQIVKGGSAPPNPPAGLGVLFPANATKLLQVEFSFDPARALRSFPGPVLVVQGANDIQVSAERDFPLLVAALKSRGGTADSVIVPSASHNLKAVSDENTEPGIAGPVAPQALEAIASWMKKQVPLQP